MAVRHRVQHSDVSLRPTVTIFMKNNCRYCAIATDIIMRAWRSALLILNTKAPVSKADDVTPVIRCRTAIDAVDDAPRDWNEVEVVSVNVGLDTRRAAQCKSLSGGARTVPQVRPTRFSVDGRRQRRRGRSLFCQFSPLCQSRSRLMRPSPWRMHTAPHPLPPTASDHHCMFFEMCAGVFWESTRRRCNRGDGGREDGRVGVAAGYACQVPTGAVSAFT